MKLEKKFIAVALFLVASMFSCENIDDTYKEYAGDGKIKYLGKCKSFSIDAGWKRFVFQWEKSPDADIKAIKIDWKCDTKSGSYTIPADKLTFETEATFEDVPYTFECYAIDDAGNKSIPIVKNAKPFTDTHELVAGFPKMVNKYAYVTDKSGKTNLILFFDKYDQEINDMSLDYYVNNEKHTLPISQQMCNDKYYVLKNVDIDKAVSLNLAAHVEGCIDLVVFEPYVLNPQNMSLNYDFTQALMQKYNINDITADFINQLEVLEVDLSMNSLEDILFFPNLKKLVLGGNRFMVKAMTPVPPPGSSNFEKNKIQYKVFLSSLQDADISTFAITQMHTMKNIEVVVHNDHFGIGKLLPFAILKGDPELPSLSYFDASSWTVVSSSKEGTETLDPAQPENILDDDPKTLWHPQTVSNYIRTHKIDIDMQQSQLINGFKITQAGFNNQVGKEYFPDIIRIMLSEDGVMWEEAFNQVQSFIGTNFGESTILEVPTPRNARYVRIIVTDKVDVMYKRSNTCLGDFMIF